MKKIIFTLLAAVITFSSATAQPKNKVLKGIYNPNAEFTYLETGNNGIHRTNILSADAEKNTILVNEEVTTHVIMPENIKLVDISTYKIVGNQCADNIVRLKPAKAMADRDIAGTITIIGERNIAQFNVVYTKSPDKAFSVYTIRQEDLRQYTNPDVTMPVSDMARLAWAVFSSKRKFHSIHSKQYGIKAQVNNIYTVNDYFFIDFSMKNLSNIKYDVAEIRLKLMDKKELKATNSQTIELTPVFTLNPAKTFNKEYRNVIVLKKLTFPNEKKLRLEISEDQISGRVSYIDIDYRDILNADSFSSDLLKNLH